MAPKISIEGSKTTFKEDLASFQESVARIRYVTIVTFAFGMKAIVFIVALLIFSQSALAVASVAGNPGCYDPLIAMWISTTSCTDMELAATVPIREPVCPGQCHVDDPELGYYSTSNCSSSTGLSWTTWIGRSKGCAGLPYTRTTYLSNTCIRLLGFAAGALLCDEKEFRPIAKSLPPFSPSKLPLPTDMEECQDIRSCPAKAPTMFLYDSPDCSGTPSSAFSYSGNITLGTCYARSVSNIKYQCVDTIVTNNIDTDSFRQNTYGAKNEGLKFTSDLKSNLRAFKSVTYLDSSQHTSPDCSKASEMSTQSMLTGTCMEVGDGTSVFLQCSSNIPPSSFGRTFKAPEKISPKESIKSFVRRISENPVDKMFKLLSSASNPFKKN